MFTRLLWFLFPKWCQRVIENAERRRQEGLKAKATALAKCMMEQVLSIVGAIRLARLPGGERFRGEAEREKASLSRNLQLLKEWCPLGAPPMEQVLMTGFSSLVNCEDTGEYRVHKQRLRETIAAMCKVMPV